MNAGWMERAQRRCRSRPSGAALRGWQDQGFVLPTASPAPTGKPCLCFVVWLTLHPGFVGYISFPLPWGRCA